MLFYASLFGACGALRCGKRATGRLEENKNNAQALSQGIILFALMVCFLVFGGPLDDLFSGYRIWHTYRLTREFIMQMRLALFLRYEIIGFSIANFGMMASAYLIMQICRQLLAFISLKVRQMTAFFGRIFGRR